MPIDGNEVPLSPITATKLIAVEGKEEVNFLCALRDSLGIGDMEIRDIAGKYVLPTKLKSLVNTSGFNNVISFGVMRDADANAQAAFQSVCDALRNAGQAVPVEPLKVVRGTRGKPRVVVLILPHGSNQGMLEDVCLQSVVGDPAMTCVGEYFQCVKRNLGSLPSNLSKAKVHAFLSSRDQPDLRLGEAAQKGYWLWDNQAFDQVKQFLSML